MISNLGKLFTSVLIQRLLKWSQCNDVITDAQFGFRPGYGTVDAIFVLNSIIPQTLNNKKIYRQLSSQARKALFSLYTNVKNMYLNVKTSLLLFDMYIGSILQYAFEIWGLHHGDCLEKVHLYFCKRLLGFKKSSCNVMIYAELGRLQLQAVRR